MQKKYLKRFISIEYMGFYNYKIYIVFFPCSGCDSYIGLTLKSKFLISSWYFTSANFKSRFFSQFFCILLWSFVCCYSVFYTHIAAPRDPRHSSSAVLRLKKNWYQKSFVLYCFIEWVRSFVAHCLMVPWNICLFSKHCINRKCF